MKVAEPPVIVPFETPNAPTSGSLWAVTMSAPTAAPRETPTPVLETEVVTAALVVNVTASPLFACTCAQSPRNERMIGVTVATAFVNAPENEEPEAEEGRVDLRRRGAGRRHARCRPTRSTSRSSGCQLEPESG